MVDCEVDGAALWFPAEVELVEVVTFIDRRYLGAITRRSTLFYGSLMRRTLEGIDSDRPTWSPHTLWEAMTTSVPDAKEMILKAYEDLTDRLGAAAD